VLCTLGHVGYLLTTRSYSQLPCDSR
jgi:hypothetical protein